MSFLSITEEDSEIANLLVNTLSSLKSDYDKGMKFLIEGSR